VDAVGKIRLEIGDIVLAPGVLVRGVLVDPEGNPIPNRKVDLVALALQPPTALVVAAPLNGQSPTIAAAPRTAGAGPDRYTGVRSARSDGRGRFAFADVSAGEYQIKCESSNPQRPATLPVSVVPGEPLEPLKLVVDVGLAIRGRVVDADDRPLAGARLRVLRTGENNGPSAQADADGRFTILDVPPGPCRLRVDSWSPREGPLLAPTTSDVIQSGEKNCVVRVPLGRSIQGVVVERDGTPVRGARVELRVADAPDWPFVRPDKGSEFYFTVPIDATCTLRAAEAGRESAELTLLDGTDRVRLELPPR
jgi:protocatechuate 3,4-dioxygenase beta subunit